MQGNNQQGQGNQGGMQKPTLSWQAPSSNKAPEKPVAPKAAEKPVQKNVVPAKAGEKSNMSMYSSIFVAGLIVGALIGWGVTGSRSGGALSTATDADHTDLSASAASSSGSDTGAAAATDMTVPGLSIATQTAGLTVSVANAVVTAPTWVVIYEDHNGVPGNALGAKMFFPVSEGGTTSGTVELLRGTTAGQTYLAGESLDDGDHLFSMQNDKPVRDEKGNPVLVKFSTQ